MPRTKASTNGKPGPKVSEKIRANEMDEFIRRLAANQELSRGMLASYMGNGGHNIDGACGYPTVLGFQDYKEMYDREGTATRVVSLFPTECWAVQPWVYETEEIEGGEETAFEKRWKEVTEAFAIFNKLFRADEASGLGHYGVLLIGINDGRNLDQPIEGLDAKGKVENPKPHEITYIMPFNEGEAQILELDKTPGPHFGKPLYYNLMFANVNVPTLSSGKTQKVHWSRCIHVADGCTTSDVFGTPRMKNVFNYLLNIRKILGGSAEMFWHGGFPGTAFEVPPDLVASVDLDKESLTKELEEYYAGFKRYLALSGVHANQLNPNIADPDKHIKVQTQAICIAKEVPMRIFTGSEEARLASTQDMESWNRRLHRRQDIHVTPNILRPFVDRLIMMGVLPKPEEPYKVKWPDVYAISQKDKADITAKLTRALAEYIKSGTWKLFPPLQFFTLVMDLTADEAEMVIMAAEEAVKSGEFDHLESVMGPPGGVGAPLPGSNKRPGSNPRRRPSPGTSPSVKIANVDTMRCQRDGKPGYKYGEEGKCFTYTEGDKPSQKKARRKAKLQGAMIEVSKRLHAMEQVDGDNNS